MCTAAETVVTGILVVSFQVAHPTHGSHKFQLDLMDIPHPSTEVTWSDIISPFHRSRGPSLRIMINPLWKAQVRDRVSC